MTTPSTLPTRSQRLHHRPDPTAPSTRADLPQLDPSTKHTLAAFPPGKLRHCPVAAERQP